MKKIVALIIFVSIAAASYFFFYDSRTRPPQEAPPQVPEQDISTTAPTGFDISPIERLVKVRWTGDLDGMIKRRVIRVLISYSKTFFFYDGMQPKGVTYDILQEFEKFVNQEFDTRDQHVYVAFIPTARDQIIPALLDGKGDIAAASLTITPGREKSVVFSAPTLDNIQELVVTGPSAPNISTLDNLSGHEVFVRKSSSYYEHLVKLNDNLKKSGKPAIIIKPADENLEDEDIMEMVDAGLVGITVIDSYMLKIWDGVFKNLSVHQDLAVNTGGQIAWAFRKESPKLGSVVNDFISTHKLGTAFGNALAGKYFGGGKRLKNVTADKEMQKFETLKEIFKKYGDEYSLDWLFLAAQGYQESGLNQNARSRRGAIGIMQLLPSTAASPQVGIPNINTPENNIHAGAKLLRVFIDNYFNEDEISNFNKWIFTIASYNAGPSAISGLRKKTAAMGLDPDIWFRNVEVAAARYIGPETVQYIGNVFKYYMSYKMALEHEQEKQTDTKK